ncbi:MAG: exocyst complex component exo84, partial [Chaenotheca gracillima]
ANVGVREGRWYWECKITSGIRQPNPNAGPTETEPQGHVRIGWARREASLDAPVGFDAYSYGLRDVGGQKVHMSRPKDFFPPGEDIREGDVIGLEINLPSLALHRKIVEGQYNPAVDVSDAAAAQDVEPPDIIRDRVPIRYRAHLYFEQFEYHPTKELE